MGFYAKYFALTNKMKIVIKEIDRIELLPENDVDFALLKHLDNLGTATVTLQKPATITVDEKLDYYNYNLSIKFLACSMCIV